MILAAGEVLLGAPLPAVRRALKLQRAEAVFGRAGKRRVRLFAPRMDVAALTARISRVRLLAFTEGEAATQLAVWRAGRLKLQAVLPRVLRDADELRAGSALAERLAQALAATRPGAVKAGTASLDLAAGIAGVGASELRGLQHAELLRRAEALSQLPASERAGLALAPLLGLRRLEADGAEVPLLPLWAEEGRKILARAVTSAAELLERLEEFHHDALTANQRAELLLLARGELPFPVSPAERAQLCARAQALLDG